MDFRGAKGASRRRSGLNIDITPLVDVVFLLLIFFLITSTFVRDKQPAIPIDAPQAKSARELTVQPSTVTVHVSDGGRIFLEQTEMEDMDALEAALKGLVRAEGAAPGEGTATATTTTTGIGTGSGQITLLIRADKEARHGLVVQIMDLARRVGLGNFGIVTQEE